MATGKPIPPIDPAVMAKIVADLQRPQTGKGKAWQAVAEAAVSRLGPEWIVTGKRMETSLVRTPLWWWYEAISFNPARIDGELWYERQPLLEPVQRRRLGFYGGLSQQGLRRPSHRQFDSYSLDAPRELPVFDLDAAVDVVEWWATGPIEEIRSRKTDRQWAESAENAFARRRFNRPIRWTALPGWRVLLDTGSPVEPLDVITTELLETHSGLGEHAEFWQRFAALAHAGSDRITMLKFLDRRRQHSLSECLIPESAVADVLTGQE